MRQLARNLLFIFILFGLSSCKLGNRGAGSQAIKRALSSLKFYSSNDGKPLDKDNFDDDFYLPLWVQSSGVYYNLKWSSPRTRNGSDAYTIHYGREVRWKKSYFESSYSSREAFQISVRADRNGSEVLSEKLTFYVNPEKLRKKKGWSRNFGHARYNTSNNSSTRNNSAKRSYGPTAADVRAALTSSLISYLYSNLKVNFNLVTGDLRLPQTVTVKGKVFQLNWSPTNRSEKYIKVEKYYNEEFFRGVFIKGSFVFSFSAYIALTVKTIDEHGISSQSKYFEFFVDPKLLQPEGPTAADVRAALTSSLISYLYSNSNVNPSFVTEDLRLAQTVTVKGKVFSLNWLVASGYERYIDVKSESGSVKGIFKKGSSSSTSKVIVDLYVSTDSAHGVSSKTKRFTLYVDPKLLNPENPNSGAGGPGAQQQGPGAQQQGPGAQQQGPGAQQQRVFKAREPKSVGEALSFLGLKVGATAKEVTKAYRKLALKWHPDKHKVNKISVEEATAKFQEIGGAYRYLKEENRIPGLK